MSISYQLKTALYSQVVKDWPESGNHILAQFDSESVIVYQAYNSQIAAALVKCQNFHAPECQTAGYKITRMSWIKTNFLWMMYRCGWASKVNQERILAIRISRDGFESILSLVKNSNHSKDDQVRLQWDPDHELDYSSVSTGRRAIQLGLRGEALMKFSKSFIISITDITDFVVENVERIQNPSELLIPIEKVYTPRDPNCAIREESITKIIPFSIFSFQ